jgi:hypothetical protein
MMAERPLLDVIPELQAIVHAARVEVAYQPAGEARRTRARQQHWDAPIDRAVTSCSRRRYQTTRPSPRPPPICCSCAVATPTAPPHRRSVPQRGAADGYTTNPQTARLNCN